MSKIQTTVVKGFKAWIGYNEIHRNAVLIAEMANLVLNPFRKIVSRVETFEEAYERTGCTEERLQAIYRNLVLCFYIGFVFGCWSLYVMFLDMNMGDALGAMYSFACVCLFLGVMFKHSFRAYQFRIRELCGVGKWTKVPDQWIPLSFNMKG